MNDLIAGVVPPVSFSEGTAVYTSELNFNDRSKISWVTATAFGSFHILAVVALFYTTWQALPGAFCQLPDLWSDAAGFSAQSFGHRQLTNPFGQAHPLKKHRSWVRPYCRTTYRDTSASPGTLHSLRLSSWAHPPYAERHHLF